MGTAFGGAATDALFGAGTGNALTTLTRYAATLFFVLAVVLTILNAHRSNQGSSAVKSALQKQAGVAALATNQTVSSASTLTNQAAAAAKAATNNLLLTTSNAPAAPK